MKVLFIFGTRPEAIKLAPLIRKVKKHPQLKCLVCVTGQHKEMLQQVLDFFEIAPDFDLALMQPNQSSVAFTARAMLALEPVFNEVQPDLLIVQGDTNTVLAGALSGFYSRIKVAHVEAGLRSHNRDLPFPEEINRILTSRLADFHFAPTDLAKKNLENEKTLGSIYNVGNTVIDALYDGLDILKEKNIDYSGIFSNVDFSKKIVLVTCHRREIFGEKFKGICIALNSIAQQNPDITIVYPVHLNPNINNVARKLLNRKNIVLLEPLGYPQLIWLMNKSYLIITDSGGIQEEGPALGKPVLVMRDVTERTEGIEAGTAKLIGTDSDNITREIQYLLDNENTYTKMARAVNPYGDGTASEKIVKILESC